MSDLATCLGAVAPELQSGAAYQLAPSASLDELIDALKVVPLHASAEDHLIDELVERGLEGLDVLDVIEQTLLADTLAPFARRFGETLVRLYQREPSVRVRVVETLIKAAESVLAAGGGTTRASSFFIFLADCANIRRRGPILEAAPVARRLLTVAEGEQAPSPVATLFAQRVLDPPLRREGRAPKPRSRKRR